MRGFKNCLSCNAEFPTYMIIDGIKRNLGNRKNCLECVPFESRFLIVNRIGDRLNKEVTCKLCGRIFTYNRIHKGHHKTQCNSCSSNTKKKLMKQKIIDYLGGKCVNCGYNKCNQALDIHHKNPNEKNYDVASNYHKTWENLVKEIDKCILLCFNCHRELHANLI
jgi:hypothetical protein